MTPEEHKELLTDYRVRGRLLHSELDTITYMRFRRPEHILIRAINYLINRQIVSEIRGGGEGRLGLLDWTVARNTADTIRLLNDRLELICENMRTRLGDE